MPHGYMGRILWVDLTNHTFRDEEIPDDFYEKLLGGYGLAAKIIFDHQEPGLGRFDEKNILAVMSGLLTNGRAVFNGRWMVAGKSPLTGGWGDANCGGDFAPAIKQTGYDGIFFVGKSETPVYLLIDGESKKLVAAEKLWGHLDTRETQEYLRHKHGSDCKVICLGAGGENLSLIAGVTNDNGRLAGRSGLGALMGSKNLKAICLRGNHKVEVDDENTVWEHTQKFLDELNGAYGTEDLYAAQEGKPSLPHRGSKMTAFGHVLKNFGTAGTLTYSSETGDSPVKNWQGTGEIDFPQEQADRISGYSLIEYEVRKYHCYGCPLGCGGICHIPGEPLLEDTHRPEYETLCGFGTQLLSDDLISIFMVNELLNRAGIDTISCAVVVNWAFEAYDRGHLTTQDTAGLRLTWGNGQAVVELVKKIIAAEGIGAHLKDGVAVAARYFSEKTGFDMEEYAMHVHGQGLPMHDSRRQLGDGGLGLGVGYEVEPTPGRHTSTFPAWDQFLDNVTKPENPAFQTARFTSKYSSLGDTLEQVGEKLKGSSCTIDILNGLGMCFFGFDLGPTPPLVEWINATTGWNKTFADYVEIGRRIKTIRHAFNIREGIDPTKINMPERARGYPPLTQGPNAYSPNVLRWDDAEREYYKAMGWDPTTAKPLPETLDELGLQDVKRALYNESAST